MNPNNRMNQSNDRTKATAAALPMAGAIVTAALLLSGVFLMSSYHLPVLAQEQNMTEGGGAAAGGGILEGRNATNATGAAGGNQSEIRTNLEQARMALQNNDTQGAMMYLDMALSALGGGAGAAGGALSNATEAGGGALSNATGEAAEGGGGILEGIFGGGG